MRIGFLNGKATNTNSEYVIEYVILVAFPRQQWLYERTSVLRYTYGALHVFLEPSLNLRLQKLFYPMHNGTQSIINNHYLNWALFYIVILVTYIIIAFLIIIGCYGSKFYDT
jgi:hypothetical protein